MAMKKNISVFIDAEYVIKSAKILTDKPSGLDISKSDINWSNLIDIFAKIGILEHAYYYTSILNKNENIRTCEEQKRYLKWLQNLGIVIRLGKMVKTKHGWIQKGVDIQMAIDIVTEKCDIAVLVTGDSDFEPAVEKLRKEGKEIFLVTFSRHGGQTPKGFIDLCSNHDEIDYRTGKYLGIWN